MVASDVDGTLLGVDERVSGRTASVTGRVRASGIPFVLVSGRPPRWMPGVAGQAGVDGLAVCANGAVLYDVGEDRVIWQRGLSTVQLSDIASALDTVLPGAGLAAERIGKSAWDIDPFVAETAYTDPWGNGQTVVTRGEVLGHSAVKLLVRKADMLSGEMAEAANAVLRDEFSVTYSTNSGLIEIAARDVTKASGLSDVAERFGVAAEDVIAFGDMPNDVPMLRWVGHGVAMANAHPEALDAANEVTAANTDDGVALTLERWF